MDVIEGKVLHTVLSILRDCWIYDYDYLLLRIGKGLIGWEALFRAAWISNDTHYIFFIIWSSGNSLFADVSTETPHGYIVLYAHAASQDFQTHSHNTSQISSEVLAILNGTSDVRTEQPERIFSLKRNKFIYFYQSPLACPGFILCGRALNTNHSFQTIAKMSMSLCTITIR